MANVFGFLSGIVNRGRTPLVIGVVFVAALTLGGFFWLVSEKHEVLFTDLEPRDAASVVSELEKMKVEYSLANGGTQIRVPESSVHEVRLKLMGAGVPLVGGVGFEIFDDSNFGMTDFAQRINYQRALEGELTRTVMSLKEVKYARVHLVLPERGVFQQDDNPPSASVTLFLNAGHRPGEDKILGIQRLLSAAVPSLKPSQVTVTDQEGLTLSRHSPEQEGVAAVSGRLEQKQAVEKYLAKKADEVLERNFGAQQSMVSIDATLDFNQVRRTRESVVPSNNRGEGGVVRRRETNLGSGSTKHGEDANFSTEVEYRLGRDVEQIIEAPGNIVRLSVGVMVPPETSEARRSEICELVKMAVGFDASRGDAIAIYPVSERVGATPAQGSSPQLATNATGVRISADALPAKEPFYPPNGNPLRVWVSRHPMGAGSAVTLAILGFLFIGFLSMRRKTARSSLTGLSDEDRTRVLEDIRRWLDDAE